MYKNYGDKNFLESGRLMEPGHDGNTFSFLYCEPYQDSKDMYLFGDGTVDISDSWIDRDAVMSFIGMTQETFDPVVFALGCLDYYSLENFGVEHYAYDWRHMNRDEILKILKYRDIEGGLESIMPEECL